MGAQAYYAGKRRHVSGVDSRDDKLVIRLAKPAPDLPRLAASVELRRSGRHSGSQGGLENTGRLGRAVLPRRAHRRARGAEAEPELRRIATAAPRRDRRRSPTLRRARRRRASRTARSTTSSSLRTRHCLPNTQAARAAGQPVSDDADRDSGTSTSSRSTRTRGRSSRRPDAACRAARARPSGSRRLEGGGIAATRLLSSGVPGYRGRALYPHRRTTCGTRAS